MSKKDAGRKKDTGFPYPRLKYHFTDGNWLLHRAFSVVGRTAKNPTERIPLMLLDWFCQYSMRLGCVGGAICFDGNSNFRYQLFPDYKINRRSGEGGPPSVVDKGFFEGQTESDAVYASLLPTIELFHNLGLIAVQDPTLEADDLQASAAYFFGSEPNTHVYLSTCDKDAFQNVSESCTVYRPEIQKQPEVFYTPERVRKKTGFLPKQFLNYQILIGDAMDSIPAVLTPAKAKAIVLKYPKLSDYFATPEGKKFYEQNASELHRNKDMVTMVKKGWPVDDVSFTRAHGSAPSKAFTALMAANSKKSLF